MGVEQGSSWTDLWGSRFTWQGTVAGGRAGFVASVAVVGLGVVFAPVVAPVAAATGVSAAATGCMVVAGGTTLGAAKGFVTDASNSSTAGAKAGGKFAREYYFPD